MHGNQHPPQYGYAQPYPQTVIVQKKGGGCLRGILIGAAVLAGLVVVGGILGGSGGRSTGSEDTTVAEASAPTKEQTGQKRTEQRRPGIGDPAKDGKFSFKVTKVEKGVERVGGEYLGSDAQGQYVLVHVTVKNIGDEAQLFSDSSQKLIDARGRQYDADSGTAALGLKNSNAFLNNINPGNAVSGILLFDVPKEFRIKAIELHDSAFSGGVTVALND